MLVTTRSSELFLAAQELMPGGVNSPVRAFRAVGGDPVYIKSGAGSHVTDVDGNSYLDFLASWGPMLLGHAHPAVVSAVHETAVRGLSFGACCELEVEMARAVQAAFPSMQRMRMVSSGTEATMSALRVARGFTGRAAIVKFEGCYHGHSDQLLAKAGSGAMTFDIPDSAGVHADVTRHTLTVPYNDLEALEACFQAHPNEIAAVIIEPVAGNMGVVPPQSGFLQGVRNLTRKANALLIFDEVITGFRLARGGAQAFYGIEPDLTTLGKIVGGGLPVGSYGGRKEIMDVVAPVGPVYQAGTLSGNPVALACGLATLRQIEADAGLYDRLEARAAMLGNGLAKLCQERGIAAQAQRVGSMMTLFFTDKPVVDYASAKRADTARYARYFRSMLAHGCYIAPSQFEAMFVGAAHSEEDIRQALAAAALSLDEVTAG